MKYVLDSSVAVKFVLPEPDSSKAIKKFTERTFASDRNLVPKGMV
jgi:hypothetical protein